MKRIKFLVIAATIMLLASCTTPKTIGYLLDMEYDTEYAAKAAPELKVESGDVLDIKVTAADAALAVPFRNGEDESANKYAVDKDGNITFPVLGKIYVAGNTLDQIKDRVSGMIISSGYIKEPDVTVNLDNFYITVIGDVSNSVMRVADKKINLLQVLAKSGGTAENVKIQDVMVIREEGGYRKAYSVNLQTKDLFDSPVYYLQQNDIVYFKHRGFRMSQTTRAMLSILNAGISTIGVIATILVWTKVAD